MKKSYVDLHMHSCYSDDGQFTPEELVDLCYEAGVKIMAIADHNSVKAIDRASKRAKEMGITYIPAIEIDCTYQGINLHVLGYGIDYKNPIFAKLEENILHQELSCSTEKLELTNALGFDLRKEQLDALSANGVYTGEMFGEVLLTDPRYNDHELLKPYREGGERSDNPFVNFYWDFYAQGKPCYTKVKFPSLEKVIEIINNNGGVAVLAHPGNNLKGKFEVFDDMVKIGLQGVECYSNYHDQETNNYFLDKAKKLNILYTCGSDFHGKTKPAIKLGENGCLKPEIIEENLRRYQLVKRNTQLLCDYHIHSNYSDDSWYLLEKLVEDAIAMELDEICITDHVDYGIKLDWDQPEKIQYDGNRAIANVNYEKYYEEIKHLQEKYHDKIVIKMGMEFGMQRHTINKYQTLFDKYPFEFIIMSVHQVDDKEFWSQDYQKEKTQQEYNDGYYKEILYLVENYMNYSVLGHLDMIKRYDLNGDYPFDRVKPIITKILKRVIEDGKGIEINTSSHRYALPDLTPSREILSLYKELGGSIITIGSDTHENKHLGAYIEYTRNELKKLGFKYYCTYDNMKPIFHSLDD